MHNATPRLLRSDGPHSMRSFVRKFGLAVFWSAAEHLNNAAITGQPALSEYGFWDYFVAHPEASRIFNEAMAGKANAVVPDLLAGYDFSQFSVIGELAEAPVIR